VEHVKHRLDELRSIPALSGPEQQLENSLRKILVSAAKLSPEDSSILGYQRISNQVLFDQARSLRYHLDYDFAHGNVKGIFKPTIDALEEAAQTAASQSGNEGAYQAHTAAKAAYKEWATLYNNDYIRPFRDRSNLDYSKLFKSALDIDEFRAIDQVLSRSNAGQHVSDQVKRSMVEKNLKKYIDQPKIHISPDFKTSMRELSPVLTPDQSKEITNILRERSKSPVPLKARKASKTEIPKEPKLAKEIAPPKLPKEPTKPKKKPSPKPFELPKKGTLKPTKSMQAAAKRLETTPEDLISMTKSVTGLRKLKKDLPEPLARKVEQDTMSRMLREGKIEKEFTGEELYDILNKSENYPVFSEILGETEVDELMKIAKEIQKHHGSRKVKFEAIKKFGSNVAALKTAAVLFSLL
jgi:hypothetical protein